MEKDIRDEELAAMQAEGEEEVIRGAVEPRCDEDAAERDAEEDEFD